MKKNLKRHDKNKDALERLSGRIWDRRLFNGYVVEPVPIVVLYAIVFFVLLGMTTLFLISTATFDYPSDLETKLFQVNTIKLEDDKTNDDTEVYFETNAGTLSVKKSFFHDFDQIITEFNPGDTFYITISKEEPLSIWGLYSNSGKVFLEPETTYNLYKKNLIDGSLICVLVTLYFLLSGLVGNYVLSNAPKYPHLVLFFVRRDSLNLPIDLPTDM